VSDPTCRPPVRERPWRVLGIAALAGGVLGGLLVLYLLDPAGSRYFPRCMLWACTGLYCPGCGSLRALHCLLHADLAGALAYNPLLVVSLPFLAALSIWRRLLHQVWVPWAAFAILVLYGVLRNIPVWPFLLLAPHPGPGFP